MIGAAADDLHEHVLHLLHGYPLLRVLSACAYACAYPTRQAPPADCFRSCLGVRTVVYSVWEAVFVQAVASTYTDRPSTWPVGSLNMHFSRQAPPVAQCRPLSRDCATSFVNFELTVGIAQRLSYDASSARRCFWPQEDGTIPRLFCHSVCAFVLIGCFRTHPRDEIPRHRC